jgi:antitoxin component YwqK of YwqJK toxin-antitoxin module
MAFLFRHTPLLFLLLATIPALGQSQKLISTYYPKYDSAGMKIPLREQYFVYEEDTTVKNGKYTLYSPEGDILVQANYKDNVLDGPYVEFYENATPKIKATYSNGKKVGEQQTFSIQGTLLSKEVYENTTTPNVQLYKKYSPSGKLTGEGFVKNGLYDSTLTEYYENGAVKTTITFKEGRRTGPFSVFDPKGTLLQKGFYENDSLNGMITTYFNNGKIKSTAVYNKGSIDGIVEEYYPSGKVRSEITYQNNKKHGPAKTFYENGNPETEENYKNGFPSGYFKTFYPDGGLETESFKDGNKNQIKFKRYSKSGTLISEGTLINGQPDGTIYSYYESGKPKTVFNYKAGVKTGKNISYHENGNISEETIIKNDENGITQATRLFNTDGILIQQQHYLTLSGKSTGGKQNAGKNKSITGDFDKIKTGEWIAYWENGKIKSKEIYYNNAIHGERLVYDSDEQLIEKQYYSNGIKTGIWQTFYPSGKVKSQTTYKNNTPYGSYKLYYENGQVECSGSYINGKKTGTWNYYTEDGKQIRTEQYKNDVLVSEKNNN